MSRPNLEEIADLKGTISTLQEENYRLKSTIRMLEER
nr:MAG TPA: FOSW, CJUN PROTEIN, COILED COIL DOMAIN [Bacteriophage sp.]